MKTIFIDGKAGTTGLRIYERLAEREDLRILTLSEEERKSPVARRAALNACDIAFLCLPDAAARESVSMIENDNVVVIDTSTAHRTDPAWIYGFPEIEQGREEAIAASRRIAVPGCHASGFIALVAPLVKKGILPRDALLTVHSLTGYSGGGKKMIAEYETDEVDFLLGAPRQYALAQGHKHLPEMRAQTGLLHAPVFSPIVGDFYSGMEVTVPLHASMLCEGKGIEDVRAALAETYQGEIVRYESALGADGFLSAHEMAGKDSMRLAVFGNEERMILVAVYDNLGKGASGAAIQCMNTVMGIDKTTGLVL